MARFADYLHRRKQLTDYMGLLVDNFNPDALDNTMCQNLVSVRWDGKLFDCDFNLAMHTPMETNDGALPGSIHDITSLDELVGREVPVGSHCFGYVVHTTTGGFPLRCSVRSLPSPVCLTYWNGMWLNGMECGLSRSVALLAKGQADKARSRKHLDLRRASRGRLSNGLML